MKKHLRWGLILFLTPVALWLVLLIVLPHIDLLVMSLIAPFYVAGGFALYLPRRAEQDRNLYQASMAAAASTAFPPC